MKTLPKNDHPNKSQRNTAVCRKTYTILEVSVLLGLSRNGAYNAAREGRLPVPVIRIGKLMMVSRAALDRFLN